MKPSITKEGINTTEVYHSLSYSFPPTFIHSFNKCIPSISMCPTSSKMTVVLPLVIHLREKKDIFKKQRKIL